MTRALGGPCVAQGQLDRREGSIELVFVVENRNRKPQARGSERHRRRPDRHREHSRLLEFLRDRERRLAVADDERDDLRRRAVEVEPEGAQPAAKALGLRPEAGAELVPVTNELEGDPGIASMVWSVVTLDADGLITSIWGFRTEPEALEAADQGKPS